MQVVSIRIDDVYELVLSQSRRGHAKLTEANIVGPEGPYLDSMKEISSTKDLARFILNYFGE